MGPRARGISSGPWPESMGGWRKGGCRESSTVSGTIAGMNGTNQFSIKRMLLAVFWAGLAFALWRAVSPFDVHHFLDDDPDNIRPRIIAAFFLVPLAGAVGSLRGRPLAFVGRALLIWLA